MIFFKYTNYTSVFFLKTKAKQLEYIDVKNYVIELKKIKLPFYSLIYSLRLVK